MAVNIEKSEHNDQRRPGKQTQRINNGFRNSWQHQHKTNLDRDKESVDMLNWE